MRPPSLKSQEEQLRAALGLVVPEARLEWTRVPGTALEGFFLDPETACRPLTPEQAQRVMHDPPFWSLLWPAGETICRVMEWHGSLIAGQHWVDLGCGSGLVSVALARQGAKVTACDCDPLSLGVTRLHARRANVNLDLRRLWQGEAHGLLLADFLYQAENLPLLDRLQADFQEILVVDSRLKELPRSDFHLLWEGAGRAVPDLDPHREFGSLKVWYKGPRRDSFSVAFGGQLENAPGR